MDQRGIMAGKSAGCQRVRGVAVAGRRERGVHTEGADCGDDTERLLVEARLHVLCDLENLAGELGGNAASRLGDLQAAQDVTLCVGKRLALLEGDAGRQPVPVLADQRDVLEHDLLPPEHAHRLPLGKGLVGALDGRAKLVVG